MTYGHIVLANSKTGFIAQAIKWFTKSSFSHSLVIIPEVLDLPMCIEAVEGGVSTCRFDIGYIDNKNQGYEKWSIKIEDALLDQALIIVLNDLEIGYGFLEYPWFIWRAINRFFGRDIKKQNNWNTDGMICSQLCVAYLKAAGLSDTLTGYGSGSISPQDLHDIFVAHPDIFELVETKL